MIVEHDGRFWIVDWKSNHLGDTAADYDAAPLDAAMASARVSPAGAALYGGAASLSAHAACAIMRMRRTSAAICICSCAAFGPIGVDGDGAAGVHVRTARVRTGRALDAAMIGGVA